MRERSRFQKMLLVVLAAMILLFGVLTGVSRGRQGVEFHDALLRVQGTPDNGTYSGTAHGEPVNIVVKRESETEVRVSVCVGEQIEEHWRVEYPLEPIRTEHGGMVPGLRVYQEEQLVFEGGYDPAEHSDVIGHILYDKNGKWTMDASFDIHTSVDDNYWQRYETGVGTVLEFAHGPEQTARGSWEMYAMTTLLAALAMVMTAFPQELFVWNHRWYVKDPEPTEFYFQVQTFVSCFLTVMALVFYIIGVRQFP